MTITGRNDVNGFCDELPDGDADGETDGDGDALGDVDVDGLGDVDGAGGVGGVDGGGFGAGAGFGPGCGAGFGGTVTGSCAPATAGTTLVAPKNSSHHTGAIRTTSPDCGAWIIRPLPR
jgi:hypothetical protein